MKMYFFPGNLWPKPKNRIRFAKWWLPFCKRYGIKCTAPEAYFSAGEDDGDEDGGFGGSEFIQEKEHMKEKYEVFKKRVTENARIGDIRSNSRRDHSAVVEVIQETSSDDEDATQANEAKNVPLLIYVSREKRPSQPHHFKAGALNVLLCVSRVISNSPYILGLDCDMHCNDASSARQAMCFHLDTKISPSLALVQFHQNFHNISNNDIYNSQLRSTFKVPWKGDDGLEGPCVSGTGYYIKRVSLCGSSISEVVEDYFTGFHLHRKGWILVYNPKRPQFLGSGTTDLDEFLVQGTRWSSGLVDVAISKFSPLIYGPFKTPTFLHSILKLNHLLWLIMNTFVVSNTYFIAFSFIFLSSHSKHLYEVLATGSTFRHWVNEQRIWMMKSVTSHSYGSVDAVMEKLGMREASFFPTNKVDDVKQLKRYNMGMNLNQIIVNSLRG
ncbi:unnamed protein product [Malus baccata var. baccata]